MLIRWKGLAPKGDETGSTYEGLSRILSENAQSPIKLCHALREVDTRLSARIVGESVEVLYSSIEARPLAELCKELNPSCQVGRSARSHEGALAAARAETKIDLGTSRVRVGFTRGHLLEIVVSVPFDIVGDDEALQIASEVYLEERLGDLLMDRWVANVSVSRIARTRGLLTVQDVTQSSETRPLQEVRDLLERAQEGVWAELPSSLLLEGAKKDTWTALEIPPLDGGLQEDRVFASTICPEALKSALEGMPFSSERFTRGKEIFCYLSWAAPASVEERTQLRDAVESRLAASAPGLFVVAGTGFGAARDYLDLWILPREELLLEVADWVCELSGECQLGFYDAKWGDERVEFSESGAVPL